MRGVCVWGGVGCAAKKHAPGIHASHEDVGGGKVLQGSTKEVRVQGTARTHADVPRTGVNAQRWCGASHTPADVRVIMFRAALALPGR